LTGRHADYSFNISGIKNLAAEYKSILDASDLASATRAAEARGPKSGDFSDAPLRAERGLQLETW
jgi:hypothetical protein